MLDFLTSGTFSWSTVYLVGLLLTVAFAWLSGDAMKRKLSMILVLAWVSENFLHDHLGRDSPPWIALADLALAGAAMRAGYIARSWPAFLVVALFSIDEGIIWGTEWAHVPPNGVFFMALNFCYLAQLLVVGVSSGVVVYRTRRLHGLPWRSMASGRSVRGSA